MCKNKQSEGKVCNRECYHTSLCNNSVDLSPFNITECGFVSLLYFILIYLFCFIAYHIFIKFVSSLSN